MASFPKDKGEYHRVIFRKTYDGKQRSKTFYFKKDEYTRTEVKNWKRRKEMDFKGGDWSPWDKESRIQKKGQTIKQAKDEYLKYAKQKYADSTYDIRKRYLTLFAKFANKNKPLSELTSEVCNRWINQDLKYPTKKNRLKTLSVFFGWTDKMYGVSIDGLEVIATNREKQKYFSKQHKGFITHEQLQKVLEKVTGTDRSIHDRDKLKDFYRLAFYTTRRRSDLLHIKREWIVEDQSLLILGEENGYKPKSQVIEYVPLSEEALKILTKYEGLMFGEFNPDFVTQEFKKAVKKALPKIADKISLHSLRDSGIMYLLHVKDMPAQKVMDITGHNSLRSLELYTHKWAKKEYLSKLSALKS